MQFNKNIKGSKIGERKERFKQQGDLFLKHKTSDLYLKQKGYPPIQKVAIDWFLENQLHKFQDVDMKNKLSFAGVNL